MRAALLVLTGVLASWTPAAAQTRAQLAGDASDVCASARPAQRVVASSAAPFRGRLAYCAATAREAAAEARVHVGSRTFAAARTCAAGACLAVPAPEFYALVNTVGTHRVEVSLAADGVESSASASGLQVETVDGCAYTPPGGKPEKRAIGSVVTGFNVLDPTSQADRDRQAARLFELRQAGWRVDAWPDFVGRRLLVLAVCIGPAQ